MTMTAAQMWEEGHDTKYPHLFEARAARVGGGDAR